MGANWKKCIVTFLDIVGVKEEASTGKGSATIQKLHRLIKRHFNTGMTKHAHAYLWNDSALFLAYLNNEQKEKNKILLEVNNLKKHIDSQIDKQTYAIVVEGLAFPQDERTSVVFDDAISQQQRVVTLKTSSWAMANCFIIEKELKKHRKDWYVDSRIAKSLSTNRVHFDKKVKLLPSNTTREVRMYTGYLW